MDNSDPNHPVAQPEPKSMHTNQMLSIGGHVSVDAGLLSAQKDSMNEDGFDQAALTWQDDEITGHVVDPSVPEDDGEGINGIGFRPTPNEAYARSQKRRKQVHDWRAREAREAREKRVSRRRGTHLDDTFSRLHKKRVVRFVGEDG